jgi:DNA helicase-2/ATP-dependent DNA helicase PcrA
VPYRIARGTEFYNRKEIRDVLAYLKLLVNPADDISCLRIINTPTRGIGATTIKRLSIYAAEHGLGLLDAARQVEQVGVSTAPTKKVRAFVTMIDELIDGLDKPVRQVIEDVYRHSGLEASFSRGDEDNRQARANVEELISSAAEFDEEEHDQPLTEYLHQISLVSDIDRFEGDAGAVTLMTLHAAKGLEFPVVFMVGCEEGLLPFVRDEGFESGKNLAELEEERRLAFVGMTRAQDRLTLCSARLRTIRGQRTPQTPSRFVDELDPQALSRDDQTTSTPSRGSHRGGFYDDAAQREQIERFPLSAGKGSLGPTIEYDEIDNPAPPEYEYLKVGCMVRHSKFGLGKLVKLSQPWPDTRAEVLFHDFGRKRLVLAMTHLEMVET